jgi:hypothetical protein
MPFLMIKPEPGGHLGERAAVDENAKPPVAKTLHYEFDWWLGDDLVGSPPFFVVTNRLKRALSELKGATGFELDQVRVSTSAFFRGTNPRRKLPRFWWLKVYGKAGKDDMGLASEHSLVVSGRAFAVLLSHTIEQAEISQYGAPKGREGGGRPAR